MRATSSRTTWRAIQDARRRLAEDPYRPARKGIAIASPPLYRSSSPFLPASTRHCTRRTRSEGRMVCAKCGTDNREGRRFCAECGAPLAAKCARCGASNEPSEKFCGNCGTQLASQSATSPVLATQTSSVRIATEQPEAVAGDGERKTVAALFADIKGSTELCAISILKRRARSSPRCCSL